MSLNLMKIFEGYVRNYHTLNLTDIHGKHSFSMTEIEYFSRLGSMLGYWTFTEDTGDGSSRAMDLSWWDELKNDEWNKLILHLERENYFKKDEETLEKLFDNTREFLPENVIGIISVPNNERINELLEKAKKMCNIKNALLIFRITPTTNSGSEARAYHLKNKKQVKSKFAVVSEIQDTGIKYMYFKNE